jgi:predicted methyltransferase
MMFHHSLGLISNTPICMSTVRQILRLLARKKSMQAIIEMTDVPRNTLRKYQTRFQESGLSFEELSRVDLSVQSQVIEFC